MTTPLWQLAGRRPTDPAVDEVGTGRALSWAQLDRQTTQFGNGLATLGATPGSHVALVAGNRLELFVAIIGAWRAGCVYSPLKSGWTTREIDQVIADAGTTVVVTDRPAARTAAGARGLPVIDFDTAHGDWLAAQSDQPLPADRSGWKLTYTSGTTGRPKGVVPGSAGTLAFAVGWAGLARYAELLQLPRCGVHLFVSQLFHGAPLTFGLGALARGATVRLLPQWDAAHALTLLSDDAITSTIMVPTMFRHLLALPGIDRSSSPSPLRTLLHGGEPCPIAVKRSMVEWFGPVLVEYYGFTEGGLTITTAAEWAKRPGTVGKAVSGQSVRIVDQAGRPAPTGTAGEVTFVPDQPGRQFSYLHDEAKTAAAHIGDGFGVGDIGRLDEDGYLYIMGRSADVVICGGVNVYPAEVEDALCDVEGVADLCMVGGPDSERGESLVLFVVVAAGHEQTDVLAALASAAQERLASYKRPRTVLCVGDVPRDQTGKLLRRELRDPLWKSGS